MPKCPKVLSSFPFQFRLGSKSLLNVAPDTSLPWHRLVCVFEQIGYRQAGQKGSHIKLEKPGVARPLIVPKYDEVGLDIITNLIRTSGITREAFLALLKQC